MTRCEAGGRLNREPGWEGRVVAIRGEGMRMRMGMGMRLGAGARMGLRVWESGAVIVITGVEKADPAIIQIIREKIYDSERTLRVQG